MTPLGISPFLRGGKRLGLFSVALLVTTFWGAVSVSARESGGQRPAPTPPQVLALNPLTAEEKAAAERVALADSRVSELLGTGRRGLVSVDLLALKPNKEEIAAAAAGLPIQMARHAEVVFFRYEGEFGVRAVVDLSRKAVTEVSRLESEQVPLTSDDLAEAYKLALRNAEVRSALGPDAERFRVEGLQRTAGTAGGQFVVRGLRVQATEESDPCWKHRCLQLLFRRGDVYLTEPVVIVDLSRQQVMLQRR